MTELNESSKSRVGAILKKRGWLPLVFSLLAFKGIHGIPQAFYLLFKIGKQDIRSYDAEYSGYFLWHIYSIISDCRKPKIDSY